MDSETNGLHVIRDWACGFSIAFYDIDNNLQGYYVPTHHNINNVSLQAATDFLNFVKSKPLIFHAALFDTSMIYKTYGVLLEVTDDTMAAAYVTNQESMGLKELAYHYFQYEQGSFEDIMVQHFGKKWKAANKHFEDLTPEEAYEYASDDAMQTLKLKPILKAELERTETSGVYKLELALIPVVRKLNFTGLFVNTDLLKSASESFKLTIAAEQKAIYTLVGREFSISSPKECAALLFGELKLPVIKRSPKTGVPSTDADVLEVLASSHPVVPLIGSWRSHSRLLKAYTEKIPLSIESNGRIYPHFEHLAAVSGRLTSSSEEAHDFEKYGINFQNVALKQFELIHQLPYQNPAAIIRETLFDHPLTADDILNYGLILTTPQDPTAIVLETLFTNDIRRAFIAPEGFDWLKADYNQIEYRVAASLSGEISLIDGYNRGVDFHTLTASVMFGILPEQVTKEQRAKGKVFNFGLIYGMTAYSLGKSLGISEAEAEQLYNDYFEKLPMIKKLVANAKEFTRQNGYTKTFFNRRRYLKVDGLPPQVVGKILRKAFNTLIQGTAADILKIAMVRLYHALKCFGPDVQMLLTVHDEMDFYVRKEIRDEAAATIKLAMEIPVHSSWAKIVADIEIGKSWSPLDLQKYNIINPLQPELFTGWNTILPKAA